MNEPELWMLAISAFAAVLLLLSLLAVAIWLLTALFRAPAAAAPVVPAGAGTAGAGTAGAGTAGAGTAGAGTTSNETGDAATVAAIHAAVQRTLPGGRVVRIEEVP